MNDKNTQTIIRNLTVYESQTIPCGGVQTVSFADRPFRAVGYGLLTKIQGIYDLLKRYGLEGDR